MIYRINKRGYAADLFGYQKCDIHQPRLAV